MIKKTITKTDKIIVRAAIGKFVSEQTSSSAVRSLEDFVANVERLEYKCGVETTHSSSQNTDRLVGHGARRKRKEGISFLRIRDMLMDKGSCIVTKYVRRRRDVVDHDTSTTSDD